MSDIKDEHNSIKIKLETISQSVEASKNVNNNVKDRLVDVEKQNLSNNLLFFAIEETSGGEVVRDTKQTEHKVEPTTKKIVLRSFTNSVRKI